MPKIVLGVPVQTNNQIKDGFCFLNTTKPRAKNTHFHHNSRPDTRARRYARCCNSSTPRRARKPLDGRRRFFSELPRRTLQHTMNYRLLRSQFSHGERCSSNCGSSSSSLRRIPESRNLTPQKKKGFVSIRRRGGGRFRPAVPPSPCRRCPALRRDHLANWTSGHSVGHSMAACANGLSEVRVTSHILSS